MQENNPPLLGSGPHSNPSTPIALTIAGSDSGGGAGIQADIKTFSALSVYGASAITAVTAQNTQSVSAVLNLPADLITAQINAVLSDLNVAAIKIGMLSTSEIIAAVAAALNDCNIPIVLDPVMVAKSGDKLLQSDAINSLRDTLLPMADMLTPNLPEAATLLDCAQATTQAQMLDQGKALLALGPKAVLMKGGHASGNECVDFLLTSGGLTAGGLEVRLASQRVNTQNTHGTGCTLSAAIAAFLAQQHSMSEAVKLAHTYLQQAIGAANSLQIGSGHGPVHHFHGIWPAQAHTGKPRPSHDSQL